jgi:hypothetical protein
MVDFFNARELAIAMWVGAAIIACCFLPGRPLISIVKALLAPQFIGLFWLFVGYVAFCVFILHWMALWNASDLKTTLLWGLFTAAGMMGRMIAKEEHPKLISGWMKDSIGAAIFVEFIANLYTFPLWGELLLVPLLVFTGGMLAVAQGEKRYKPVAALLQLVIVLFGLFLLGRGLWLVVANWSSFATLATLRDFYMAPLLSFALIPFLYLLYLFVRYETAFTGLQFSIKDKSLRDYAQTLAIAMFNLRPHLLRRWQREVGRQRPTTKIEVVATINAVLHADAREKNPPHVDPRDGWCPIAAGKFVAEDGFPTGDYHRVDDGAWFSSAPMKAVTQGLWSHNMAYYIEGVEKAAHALRLKLYVNGPEDRDAAEAIFKRAGRRLLERALAPAELEGAVSLLETGAPFVTNGDTSVSLKREDFPNQTMAGYELTLGVKRLPTFVALPGAAAGVA